MRKDLEAQKPQWYWQSIDRDRSRELKEYLLSQLLGPFQSYSWSALNSWRCRGDCNLNNYISEYLLKHQEVCILARGIAIYLANKDLLYFTKIVKEDLNNKI